MKRKISLPQGKRFAFTIFDDTDSATLANIKPIYALLAAYGLRTTKSVWPTRGTGIPVNPGATCQDEDYSAWAQALQRDGFEIGYHMATFHSSRRVETNAGIEEFKRIFGQYPRAMANHVGCQENIYWGDSRFTGLNRTVYNLLTRNRNRQKYRGHVEGDDYFWGDICRDKIKYVRDFVFSDINSYKCCPMMPYHDPARPYVNQWFSSSNGVDVRRFNQCIAEKHQDRLEAEGGICIMYTHFGFGFFKDGQIDARFQQLIERLSKKNGWFVPVSVLLDYLMEVNGPKVMGRIKRTTLEIRWLMDKVRIGGTA